MTDTIGKSLDDLKLSSDELKRLKKAFDDPEFRKLFKEYADEISDPKNRKTYEEEIRMMELDRGMDVKFINPEPGYCLKSRHWPDLVSVSSPNMVNSSSTPSDNSSHKVFINVCKSEAVGSPEMKPINKGGGGSTQKTMGSSKASVAGGKHGWYWSLPHCFTPSHEEFDKRKTMVTVYDVAFHPKAFDLAATNSVMRRLITVTAVDGIQRQHNLRFGKTYNQAKQLAELTPQTGDNGHLPMSSTSTTDHSPPANGTSPNHDELILSCFHTLKGTTYKGVARSAVIRNPHTDGAQRLAAAQRKDADALLACETEEQREAIRKLSALATHPTSDKQPQQERNPLLDTGSANDNPETGIDRSKTTKQQTAEGGGPHTPAYTVAHSSDFDMLNCRDTADVDPLRRPDRLCVTIHLPGITTTNSVDLQVTQTHLSLHSDKPVAYRLDLALPYPVDDSKGLAEFTKSTNQLCITLPVVAAHHKSDVHLKPKSQNGQSFIGINGAPAPLIVEGTERQTMEENKKSNERRRRRPNGRQRRNRRASTAATETDSSDASSGNATSTTSTATFDQIPHKENEVENGKRKCNDRLPQQQKPSVTDSVGGSINSISVPVSRVSMQQLTVTKDRRLAPVRFRQDPYSLTVLLDVRGILPNSLTIYWSELQTGHPNLTVSNELFGGDHSQTADCGSAKSGVRVTNPPPLLMLINFSSRGSGGCTMDWGVVLCCPSIPPIASNEDACDRKQFSSDAKPPELVSSQSGRPAKSTTEASRPQVTSYRLSSTNAVLVLAKPDSCPSSPSTDTYSLGSKAKLLAEQAVWWSSVATGRTLTAGMQDCPFIGMMEVCRSAPTGLPNRLDVAEENRCVSATDAGSRQVLVTHLSPEWCQVNWTSVHRHQQVLPPDAGLVQTSLPSVDIAAVATVYKSHTTNTQVMPNDPAIAVNNPLPPRSILKQRSYSESSGDEQIQMPYQNDMLQQHSTQPLSSSAADRATLRLAGVAGTSVSPFLSSDEFPSASSSDEADDGNTGGTAGRRRCVSTDKLLTMEASSLPERDRHCSQPGHIFFPIASRQSDGSVAPGVGRQRRRSVNFSQHDQKLDYWPKDTVEALHFTLLHKNRRARRRQIRRNCSNSGAKKVSPGASSLTSGTVSPSGELADCQRVDSADLHPATNSIWHGESPPSDQCDNQSERTSRSLTNGAPENVLANTTNGTVSQPTVDTARRGGEQPQAISDPTPRSPCQSAVELTSGVILELDC